MNNNHWVCVSNTDGNKCDNSVCYLYDSLASSEVAKEITKDVAAFSMCTDDSIHFITMPVHQQSNGVDCGVFAIAFAVALAHGKDSTLLAFEESLMRSHLLECLEDKKVRLFPTKDKRIKKCKTKTTTVRLYCTCRQPYDEKNDKMIECGCCHEWFHFRCEKIKKKKMDSVDWTCSKCKKWHARFSIFSIWYF